ncbi:unannotated protein [freshwater metagenome]|uniref:Unannotated protein n=1 Tax=freshwater metagenome TaxID=449393 RepID=A0A6J7E7Z7_9ZZZZ|nr:OsmC family peroxiredoxin [Actinomycetota bacterium]
MSYTATAYGPAGSLRHEIGVNGRHTIVTDEPESLGGTDTGPAPHELLPAALASCISTMVALYALKRDWAMGEVRVDVHYDHDVEPRAFTVEIQLPPGLSDDQIARLTKVANTCPVRRALEAGFTFDERIVEAAA